VSRDGDRNGKLLADGWASAARGPGLSVECACNVWWWHTRHTWHWPVATGDSTFGAGLTEKALPADVHFHDNLVAGVRAVVWLRSFSCV